MGLLLGLPLRLLGLIFALLRVLIPIALIVFFIWLWRRQRGAYHSDEHKKDEPHFKGPVYTVDYQEVKDDKDQKDSESESGGSDPC